MARYSMTLLLCHEVFPYRSYPGGLCFDTASIMWPYTAVPLFCCTASKIYLSLPKKLARPRYNCARASRPVVIACELQDARPLELQAYRCTQRFHYMTNRLHVTYACSYICRDAGAYVEPWLQQHQPAQVCALPILTKNYPHSHDHREYRDAERSEHDRNSDQNEHPDMMTTNACGHVWPLMSTPLQVYHL